MDPKATSATRADVTPARDTQKPEVVVAKSKQKQSEYKVSEDQVSISGEAMELAEVHQREEPWPEGNIDKDRIAQIRQRVENGFYDQAVVINQTSTSIQAELSQADEA